MKTNCFKCGCEMDDLSSTCPGCLWQHTPEFPVNWEDCTTKELQWLASHGTYGQKLIANRHIADRSKF